MNKITKIITVSAMLSLSSCTVVQRTCVSPIERQRPVYSVQQQKANDRARRAITWATIGIMIGFVATH
jgi:hypothetical protein